MSEPSVKDRYSPYLLFARGVQGVLALLVAWKANFNALPVFLGIQAAVFVAIEVIFFLLVRMRTLKTQLDDEEKARQRHEARTREREQAFRDAQKASSEKYLEVEDFYKWRREQENTARKARH